MPREQKFLAEQWLRSWTVFVNQDDRLHPRTWSVSSLFYAGATWSVRALLVHLLSKVLPVISTNSSTKTSTETIQSLSNETLQSNGVPSRSHSALSPHGAELDTRLLECRLCELFHDSLGYWAMCQILEENDQSFEDEIQPIQPSVHLLASREISEERINDGRVEDEKWTITDPQLRWRRRRIRGHRRRRGLSNEKRAEWTLDSLFFLCRNPTMNRKIFDPLLSVTGPKLFGSPRLLPRMEIHYWIFRRSVLAKPLCAMMPMKTTMTTSTMMMKTTTGNTSATPNEHNRLTTITLPSVFIRLARPRHRCWPTMSSIQLWMPWTKAIPPCSSYVSSTWWPILPQLRTRRVWIPGLIPRRWWRPWRICSAMLSWRWWVIPRLQLKWQRRPLRHRLHKSRLISLRHRRITNRLEAGESGNPHRRNASSPTNE